MFVRTSSSYLLFALGRVYFQRSPLHYSQGFRSLCRIHLHIFVPGSPGPLSKSLCPADLPRLMLAAASGQQAMNVQLSLEETYEDIVPVRPQVR